MTGEVNYKIGPWVFVPGQNQLSGPKGRHRLEDRTARALLYFCQNPGQVISKEELIEEVWQGRHLSEQSVPVVISNLRKIFSESGDEVIETIPKKGYRLVAAVPFGAGGENRRVGTLTTLVAIILLIGLGVYFFQGEETAARKPGVILTLNDITNATGDDALMSQAIAMSEAGSNFLSKAGGILLIRHWWNVDAEDPTGGIYERYGDNAPIYHVGGTIIKEGEALAVTLFLNDPRTEEVLWSETYAIDRDHFLDVHLNNLARVLAALGLKEGIVPPGFEDAPEEAVSAFWVGLYLWNLGTEGAAGDAGRLWQGALEEAPNLSEARLGMAALKARWPGIFTEGAAETPAGDGEPTSLVFQGTIALYKDGDPEAAARLARQAIEASPNDFAAYALLAECLVKTGDVEDGLKAIREARLLAPFSTVYPEREAEFTDMLEGGN